MILSILATLAVVLAFLITLLVAASTRTLTMRIPSGPDAMGAVGPVLIAVVSWLAMLVAAWFCVGRGGFDWLSTTPLVAFAVVTPMFVGIGLAAGLGCIVWLERRGLPIAVAPVLGILAPLYAQGVLLALAWTPTETLNAAAWPRWTALPLFLVALIGFGATGWGLVLLSRKRAKYVAARIAEIKAQEAEIERRAALSPPERLADDLAQLPKDQRLRVALSRLPGETDPECRNLILERAQQHPSLDAELDAMLRNEFPPGRAGAIEFLRLRAEARPQWSAGLAASMELLASDIAQEGSLSSVRLMTDFVREIDRTLAAAARFRGADFSPQLAAIRTAVEATPETPRREKAVQTLRTGKGAEGSW